jgi:hypothetical protein
MGETESSRVFFSAKRSISTDLYNVLPTPLSLLQIRLFQSLCPQGDFPEKSFCLGVISTKSGDRDPSIVSKRSLLKRVKHSTRLVYSTAIAYKLAAHNSLPIAQITEHIISSVSSNTLIFLNNWKPIILPEATQDYSVEATSSGLIQFELRDHAISAWLDFIIQNPLKQNSEWSGGENPFKVAPKIALPNLYSEIFAVQYAYARCCTLLQLAHQEELITLKQTETDSALWQFSDPAFIPWLNSNSQLWLSSSPERRLICQLLTVLDEVFCPSVRSSLETYFRLAQIVSQEFQEFYRQRGVVHLSDRTNSYSKGNASPNRVYAQLALIIATQRVLRLLLEDLLGIYAFSTL